jgi:hypothetical protein
MYREEFEKPYISDIVQYYEKEALGYIKHLSISEFMAQVL